VDILIISWIVKKGIRIAAGTLFIKKISGLTSKAGTGIVAGTSFIKESGLTSKSRTGIAAEHHPSGKYPD
jgi:hypothetical protein